MHNRYPLFALITTVCLSAGCIIGGFQKNSLMQPTIFCSNGYEQYDADIKNILGQFENTVQTSDGITFKLLKPLRAVLVLTQSDYESFKLVARVPLAVELEKADADPTI